MAGDDSGGQAREMKAVYAFRGFDAELEATLPLLPHERVITQGAIRQSLGPVVQRPLFLRLSTARLVVLDHYAFRPDRVTEIPRRALRLVDKGRTVAGFRRVDVVLLMWELPGGRTRGVKLLPRALRLPITPSLPDSADELLARVVAWRDGSESEG
jgi:hypothetical protein